MIKTSAKVEKTLTETQPKTETETATKVEETPSANVTSRAPTTTTFAEVELLAPIVDSNDVESDEKDQENKDEEEIALVEPVAGSLVFSNGPTIFSYDLSSQIKTNISPIPSTDRNGKIIWFDFPKPSPDGKLLAFNISHDSVTSDVKRGIYVMDMDGRNMRMILELRHTSSSDFEFGPDGDSIVYIEESNKAIRQVFFNSEPRVDRILESVGQFSESPGFIKWHKDYLYWILYKVGLGFEIRRKNMTNSLAETEVLYRNNEFVEYFISPDENNLIIVRKPSNPTSVYQVIIKSIKDGSEIGPLSFDQSEGSQIDDFFSSPDKKWIYATRKGNNPGLVRFRADQIPTTGPIKLELVLPNVDFGAFPRFVPQVSEHDEDDD